MKSVARELLKVAKSLVAVEERIAENVSYWSWEYDSITRIATVFMDARGSLRMEIIEEHVKSGLGAGRRSSVMEDVDLGTVFKPKISLAIGLLKKRSHERSRSGSPFKRLWRVAPGFRDEASLGDIIKWKAEAMAPSASAPVAPVQDVEDNRRRLMKMIDNLDPSKVEELLRTVQGM